MSMDPIHRNISVNMYIVGNKYTDLPFLFARVYVTRCKLHKNTSSMFNSTLEQNTHDKLSDVM